MVNPYVIRTDPGDIDLDHEQLFAATTKGVFKSEDGAYSWKKVMNDRYIFTIEPSPSDSTIIYASGDNIYVSTDSGKSFNPIATDGIPAFPFINSYDTSKIEIHIKIKSITEGSNKFDEIFAYMSLDTFYLSDSMQHWMSRAFFFINDGTFNHWLPLPSFDPQGDCGGSFGNVDPTEEKWR